LVEERPPELKQKHVDKGEEKIQKSNRGVTQHDISLAKLFSPICAKINRNMMRTQF
jgi:hypothetical protein